MDNAQPPDAQADLPLTSCNALGHMLVCQLEQCCHRVPGPGSCYSMHTSRTVWQGLLQPQLWKALAGGVVGLSAAATVDLMM
jgi:hypothetical protein